MTHPTHTSRPTGLLPQSQRFANHTANPIFYRRTTRLDFGAANFQAPSQTAISPANLPQDTWSPQSKASLTGSINQLDPVTPSSSGAVRLLSTQPLSSQAVLAASLLGDPGKGILHPAIQKPVLLSVDFDDTLMPWRSITFEVGNQRQYQKNVEWINQHLAPHTLVLVNTGRSLAMLKPLVGRLGNLKVDMLALNDGQQLFVNHRGLPFNQWVKQLTLQQQHYPWTELVESHFNWHPLQVKHHLQKTLPMAGFKPMNLLPWTRLALPGGSEVYSRPKLLEKDATLSGLRNLGRVMNDTLGRWLGLPLGPSIYAATVKDATTVRLLDRAQKNSLELMEASEEVQNTAHRYWLATQTPGQPPAFNLYPPLQYLDESHPGLLTQDWAPPQMGKHQIIEYIAEQMPELQVVITAGDRKNDRTQLRQSYYQNGKIPNFPVQVGNNEALAHAMARNQFSPGHGFDTLDKGLEACWEAVQILKADATFQQPTGIGNVPPEVGQSVV